MLLQTRVGVYSQQRCGCLLCLAGGVVNERRL